MKLWTSRRSPSRLSRQFSTHTLRGSLLYPRNRSACVYGLLLVALVVFPALLAFNGFLPHCHTPPTALPARADVPAASRLSGAAATVARLERWRNASVARGLLRVYVYDLPEAFNAAQVRLSRRTPSYIRDPFCDTNFYSAEVAVHEHLLRSAVRTDDADLADFFYVPLYATCHLLAHQPSSVARTGAHFEAGMRFVRGRFPFWNRTAGRDHVLLFAQGFGARLAGRRWRRFRNAVLLVHNGEFTAPEFTPHKDVVIPPQLRHYLVPAWVDPRPQPARKKYLAQFGGQVIRSSVRDHRGSNYSGGVRQYIRRRLARKRGYRVSGVRSKTYLADMRNSRFCLAPEGWHPWSPRPYYAILMGCIPVVISESQELAFEDLVDYDSFVVWIRPSEIAGIDAKLRAISDQDIARRRAAMSGYWRLFWYDNDGLAFEAILEELYKRKHRSHIRRSFS